MSPIFLIGYMCSGKTTLGEALARHKNMTFIDLDEYVEAKAGMSVKEIFAQHGEPYFRRMELEALREVAAQDDVIVACGGGTPCQPGAIDVMNDAGITVWLQADDEALVRRLMDGRRKRPLIAAIDSPDEMRDFAVKAMAQRIPYYSKAKFNFDSSRLESEAEIAESVQKFTNQILS